MPISIPFGTSCLEDEKRGSQVFYRLRTPCVMNFFKCIEAVQSNGKESRAIGQAALSWT